MNGVSSRIEDKLAGGNYALTPAPSRVDGLTSHIWILYSRGRTKSIVALP